MEAICVPESGSYYNVDLTLADTHTINLFPLILNPPNPLVLNPPNIVPICNKGEVSLSGGGGF